jgi:hypothetical protein
MLSEEKDGIFKNLATLLSLLLPVVQIFANLLPNQAKKAVLFSDYFLLVSIFAAISAYLLIVAFKSTVWFSFTFQRGRKKRYEQQQLKINLAILDEKEIRKIIKNDELEQAPFNITPLNVYYLLIPVVIFCLLTFLLLGIFFPGTGQDILVFFQAILYVLLVALTSLTLGILYINDINRDKRDNAERQSWESLLILLFTRQALPQFPQIDFVAQLPVSVSNQSRLRTIIRVDKANYYAVDSDIETKKLFEINIYEPESKAIHPLPEGKINE